MKRREYIEAAAASGFSLASIWAFLTKNGSDEDECTGQILEGEGVHSVDIEDQGYLIKLEDSDNPRIYNVTVYQGDEELYGGRVWEGETITPFSDLEDHTDYELLITEDSEIIVKSRDCY